MSDRKAFRPVVGGTGPVLARTNRVQPWLLGASARRSAIAVAAILVAPFLASVPARAAGLVGGALAASMSTLAAITPAIRDDSKVASRSA